MLRSIAYGSDGSLCVCVSQYSQADCTGVEPVAVVSAVGPR